MTFPTIVDKNWHISVSEYLYTSIKILIDFNGDIDTQELIFTSRVESEYNNRGAENNKASGMVLTWHKGLKSYPDTLLIIFSLKEIQEIAQEKKLSIFSKGDRFILFILRIC